jgi:phage gp29-like protein
MATILDQYGNPIRSADLQAPQTSRTAWLARQWADHPGRRLTPARLKQILDEAERGNIQAQSELFADMEEQDGHILSEMGKRILPLSALDWDIAPPPDASADEKATAALAKTLVEQLPEFPQLLAGLGTGIGHGFACAEISWDKSEGEFQPTFDLQPHDWFVVAPDRKTLLLRSTNVQTWSDGQSVAGDALQPFGWIVHRHQAKPGMLARRGLHRALAWTFLLKQYALGDLAELLEIFGIPMRIGKYRSGASDEEKRTLLNAVLSIGHNAGGIIPEGMDIAFEAAAEGNADPFMAMTEYCDKTASKLITGGTLNSQADGKSSTNALGRVHAEGLQKLVASDAGQIAATLKRDLLFPLLQLNSKRPITLRRCPRFVFDTGEVEDIAVYAEALPKLAAVMQVPRDWAHSKLRIPVPKEGVPVLQVRAAPAAAAGPGGDTAAMAAASSCPHCVAAAGAGADTDPTPVSALSDQLREAAADPLKSMLEQIRHMVDSADDLAALRDNLLASHSDLPSEDLSKVMAAAFACADLSGRFDVKRGE